MDISYSTLITDNNPALADLELSWVTMKFTDEDGIGSMNSLHEAGDSIVAVAKMEEEGSTIIGSGVMVGPGILLTATHVLDEFPRDGGGPVFLTFLPRAARAWLPQDIMTVSGKSDIDESRKKVSDIALVSCTLNSAEYKDFPLMLAPMQVALPLVGERLWAFGYRHQQIDNGATSISPLVSSGLVTAAFPHGRGERMPSPCIEVDMDTLGGMSGGPVVNSDGYLVGIVSSSFEGGPSYITLIWDALRYSIKGTVPKLSARNEIHLLQAKRLGLAKIKGNVIRKPWGDVILTMSDEEMGLFVESSPPSLFQQENESLNREQLDEFIETWGNDLEEAATNTAVEYLNTLSLPSMHQFLKASTIPTECLAHITNFSVEIFDGIEDAEIISAKKIHDCELNIHYFFDLRMVSWTVEVPEKDYYSNETEYNKHFLNSYVDNGVATMDIVQCCYFKANMTFDQTQEEFSETLITWSAVKLPKKGVSVDK